MISRWDAIQSIAGFYGPAGVDVDELATQWGEPAAWVRDLMARFEGVGIVIYDRENNRVVITDEWAKEARS